VKEFLEFVIRQLVEFPDEMMLTEIPGGKTTIFKLQLRQSDVGRVIGRNGQTLGQKWHDGATTLHGIHVHGFPNMFILSTTQTAWGPNFPHMMNEQAIHIAYVIAEAARQGLARLEVSAAAEQAWVEHHEASAGPVVQMWAECTPSFWNDEGKPSRKLVRNGQYGGGVFGLTKIFEEWRAAGRLEGLETVALAEA